MADTFVPNKPEEQLVVNITKREAVLLDKLRRYPFGKFLVLKTNGIIVRVEVNDSQMIDESIKVDLD